MLAGMFIYGGIDALRDPEGKAKAADDVAPMVAAALKLPTTDTVTLVRINGGVQVVAGTMLALGKARRLSALVLAASLLPTTYAGHRFWEEVDDERRAQQRVQFLKNGAMLGGLILAAGDTGGRPSVPWQAKRAARKAVAVVGAAGTATVGAADQARKSDLVDQAHQLAQAAQESELSKRASKSVRKAAKKVKKAQYGRRALKAARKAAHKAEKAQFTKRAARAARRASQKAAPVPAAVHAAQAAVVSHGAVLASHGAAAATQVQRAASDAVDRAREFAGHGGVERFRENTATLARELTERAKDALPVAS